MINPPLKYYGGKAYLAKYIRDLAPPHKHRVIVCAGGAQELWMWPCEGVSEVVNDIDLMLTNFYQVLQDPRLFEEFKRRVDAVPFSEPEWKLAKETVDQLRSVGLWAGNQAAKVHMAACFFIKHRQSFGGAGKSFSPTTKVRTRRGMNGEVSAWWGAVDNLYDVHIRLRRVVVTCRDAVECIKKEDSPDTFFYADPPYVPTTRTSSEAYAFEMTVEQHKELLDALCMASGKVMLSGYDNDLYAERLKHWSTRVTVDRPNNAQKDTEKRRMTEVLWMNYKVD